MACSHLQVATEDSSEVIRACRVPTTFDWSILDHIRPIIRSSIRIRKIDRVPEKKIENVFQDVIDDVFSIIFSEFLSMWDLLYPMMLVLPYVPLQKKTMKLKERQRKSKGCMVAKLNKSSEKSKKR